MKVYLGADHRGFELKEKLKQWLRSEGREVEDLGAHKYDKDDDYPVYAEKVGKAVQNDPGGRGVLLCGSGTGMDAAVNKIHGVRASIGHMPEQVRAGRHDDDMNVLVVAADFTDEEKSKELVKIFIETEFDNSQSRYQRRINQIKELEDND